MIIDIERRRAVIGRSRRLGHCVCNPRLPCPCPVFIERNVCQCAGERLPKQAGVVALTRHVRKAGCASKIGQADLQAILRGLPELADPRVLVGAAAGDDAGVYQLDADHVLVQTVDVFTPCVDDAYLFGQIAAANSVSDVYAMGGRPLTALSIAGFPIDELDGSLMTEMLRGGIDKLAEAGCPVIGGHSINDTEIKLGFAITGILDTRNAIERDKAEPGDVVVLTKPLGTGMVCFAAQIGRAGARVLGEVGASMAELNRDAAELMTAFGAHACTDVTGFGLAGHLVAMARGSGVSVQIDLSRVPVFAAAAECLERGIVPGAVERNAADTAAWVKAEDEARPYLPILYDPQTSGGLLVCLPEAPGRGYVEAMHARGHCATAIVGRIVEVMPNSDGEAIVVNGVLEHLIGSRGILDAPVPMEGEAEVECCCGGEAESCCATPPVAEIEEENRVDGLAMFSEFMKEANKAGRIDARNKKLMAIALSIAHKCHPCLKIHLESAVKLGIAREDIDEAAQLAIAFGGCTAMMFYKEVCKEVGL